MTHNDGELLVAVTGLALVNWGMAKMAVARAWKEAFSRKNAEIQQLNQRRAFAELAAKQAEDRVGG